MAANIEKPTAATRDATADVEEAIAVADGGHRHDRQEGMDVIPLDQEAVEDVVHINLTWRSWLVVFIACFA